jgi:AcrR family transcriptional regulator
MAGRPKGTTATRRRRVGYRPREIRAQLILQVARKLFLGGGWDGFSIDAIAEQMRSSRALVYAHFPSKEEILLALAIESKIKRLALLEQALTLQGRARERLTAIDLVDGFLAENDLPLEIFVTSTRLRAKTSQDRQTALRALELRLQAFGAGVVREAVGAGDLSLPKHTTADDLYFALWSCVWGATAIKRSDFPYTESGIVDPAMTVRRALLVMLDGFGWRPLSHEWDYRETCRRIEREIFARESFKELAAGYAPLE